MEHQNKSQNTGNKDGSKDIKVESPINGSTLSKDGKFQKATENAPHRSEKSEGSTQKPEQVSEDKLGIEYY